MTWDFFVLLEPQSPKLDAERQMYAALILIDCHFQWLPSLLVIFHHAFNFHQEECDSILSSDTQIWSILLLISPDWVSWRKEGEVFCQTDFNIWSTGMSD